MLICIEGPNGSSKTTMVNLLKEDGFKTLSSPNGTPMAKYIRGCCRGTEPWQDLDKKVQFLLFSAARLDEYIQCIQNQDENVFCDRWWMSTYVYQCVLGGIPVEFLEYTKHSKEKVDLVVLLDAPDEVLLKRVRGERAKNPSHGVCKWTQEEESQRKIMSIYRNELVDYLNKKDIRHITINTDGKIPFEVKEEILCNVRMLNSYNKSTKDIQNEKE